MTKPECTRDAGCGEDPCICQPTESETACTAGDEGCGGDPCECRYTDEQWEAKRIEFLGTYLTKEQRGEMPQKPL